MLNVISLVIILFLIIHFADVFPFDGRPTTSSVISLDNEILESRLTRFELSIETYGFWLYSFCNTDLTWKTNAFDWKIYGGCFAL